MSLHREINLEAEICDRLAAAGWLHTAGDAALYDRARALLPADVVAWVAQTQPKAWETLTKNHGAAAEPMLLDRIRKQMDERGTLEVLRRGVEMIGLRAPIQLAQFKPALAMNADLQARYNANRLRVVRQLHYSQTNENSIDLVLFLNGIPIATAELKTDFIEARSMFFRRLFPLLDFGRERGELDVSKITLTHHKLKSQGQQSLSLSGDAELLKPLTATGTGTLQEKEKALLAEILAKLNDLFQGDVTDDDQLIYVNNVLKGKLMESETLIQQALQNTKQQFENSPALTKAIMDAIIDAFDAHTTMSKQALDSAKVREGLKDVLLGPAKLYEALRDIGRAA